MFDPVSVGKVEVHRSAHTAWRRLGDEVVVIDLDASMVYGLDDRGGRVWESIGDGCDVASLAAVLVGECKNGDGLGAVARFLAELAEAGLVSFEMALVKDGARPAAPASAQASPRILWRERVQRFGGTCGLRPAQGTPCGGKPVWS